MRGSKALQQICRGVEVSVKRNAPTILTCVGAAGVVATAVMSAKAATKASRVLEEARNEKGEDLTPREVILQAGPIYAPAILLGAATITCIFGANILNKRRQASLASAYALLDQTYKDYKKKVMDLYGEDADGKVEESIAQDHYEGKKDDKKQLFYDVYSKRFFESTMEEVLIAENETNKMLSIGWGVSLNEFYEFLGLKGIAEFDMFGWSCYMMEDMYWHAWIEFDHIEQELEDGTKYIAIEIPLEPSLDYLEY